MALGIACRTDAARVSTGHWRWIDSIGVLLSLTARVSLQRGTPARSYVVGDNLPPSPDAPP